MLQAIVVCNEISTLLSILPDVFPGNLYQLGNESRGPDVSELYWLTYATYQCDGVTIEFRSAIHFPNICLFRVQRW